MVGKGKVREESSRKKSERKAMVFWSLRSFITTISCAKTAVTYFGYLVPLPPADLFWKGGCTVRVSQVSRLKSKTWSHVLKGHTSAEWQNQDFNPKASDFKAVPFPL